MDIYEQKQIETEFYPTILNRDEKGMAFSDL
jgi:hypothetical protein